MATTPVVATDRSKHHVLSAAGSADNVTLSHEGPYVEVKNRDVAADLYFRVDGKDAVIGADGTFIVGPGEAVTVSVNGSSPVSIISVSAVAYSVTGVTG